MRHLKKKKKKGQFRGLERRSFQSTMLLQMVRNQAMKTQTWAKPHRFKISFEKGWLLLCVCVLVHILVSNDSFEHQLTELSLFL